MNMIGSCGTVHYKEKNEHDGIITITKPCITNINRAL